MYKTVMSVVLVFACSQIFSMEKNPCKPWIDMMKKACKENTLKPEEVAQAAAAVKKAGCTSVHVNAAKDYKQFFMQAGAQVECPRVMAVVNSMPVYNDKECTYTKSFNS